VSRGTTILFAFTGLISAIALAIVLFSERPHGTDADFQRLVGGIGEGSTIEPSPCLHGFDSRLEGGCSLDVGAMPGAKPFCTCGESLSR
jgi:hypothetical protein